MANRRDNERSNPSGRSASEDKGDMSLREAGQKGGQRVRELIEEGKDSGGSGSDR